MRVRRIMCPVDFSESSTAALDDAASLAQQLGAQLLIVHVDEHPLLAGAASSSRSLQMADCRARLESLLPRAPGVRYEHFLVRGKAAEEISRFARTQNVDLIVLGRQAEPSRFHRRHDGLCHAAASQCSCPVMTINYAPAESAWAG
jgi:nucleotide-binding universal stress UspA family protein